MISVFIAGISDSMNAEYILCSVVKTYAGKTCPYKSIFFKYYIPHKKRRPAWTVFLISHGEAAI